MAKLFSPWLHIKHPTLAGWEQDWVTQQAARLHHSEIETTKYREKETERNGEMEKLSQRHSVYRDMESVCVCVCVCV